MAYFTFDTSVVISRKLSDLPDNFLFSAVVLSELLAGSKDETERKRYEAVQRAYSKDNSLIVPNADDWLLASKVLYWLNQEHRRRRPGGKLPRMRAGASQRMALDALIAASARRWRATVITENYSDFKAIQRYCRVKIVRGADFFGR
jgi:predicted nucleic acid-binding protein